MRAYLLATCLIFAALVAAHLWRLTLEPHLTRDPFFIVVTALSGALFGWGAVLLRRRA
jgi:hypothetical protein